MSKRLNFHNDYHLGDCLYQLHYLLRLGRESVAPATLFCHLGYHEELSAFIPDEADIRLAPLEDRPSDSVDCWIGAEDFFDEHPNWHDYHAFYVDWFKHLSHKVGVRCPIVQPAHMFFDSPEIPKRKIAPDLYDYLIINAVPQSEQWTHSFTAFKELVATLRGFGRSVITTHPCGLPRIPATTEMGYKIVDIAKLSTQVHNIIAIDTGPTGSTFNIWNQTTVKNRFILHNTNYFTHEGCHAVHGWGQLMPLVRRSFSRTRR